MSHTVNPGSEQGSSSSEYAIGQGVAAAEESEAAAIAGREGLPRGYRMRADRHYVDVMAAHSTDQPVRMLPIVQIDCEGASAHTDLRLLIESIRSLGIIHPLLVRRHNGRYAVVAGRKRFAAARVLLLSTVPCLVHDLDDAQALALAAADNLVLRPAAPMVESSDLPVAIREVIAHHLETIRSCSDLVTGGAPALARPVFDLIRAHAWRAARLGDALDLISNAPQRPAQERPLTAVADEIVRGFEPESRLNGFTVRAQIRGELSTSGLNDRDVLVGLAAAVLATLPLVEHAVRPCVSITASASGAGALVLEIAQSDVPVSASTARHFFDSDSGGRNGGYSAVAGALAARALAARHGGTATFEAAGHGSTLRMVLSRRS